MFKRIGVIGLGYVGLPLAVEFSKKYKVIGFDINLKRVKDLNEFNDFTNEVCNKDLIDSIKKNSLKITSEIDSLKKCNYYIITVPTPITNSKKPDLSYLLKATELVGNLIEKNDVVIYESTVYPGCTEEDCVPILELKSGLKYNEDFYCGYSPERINPGDKINTLTKIKKITSGSNDNIAKKIDELYASIIEAGTYLAPSIKVAEAAKAIENAQRDLNISFVNELALIFDKLDINTTEVLMAASTKWNFLNFKPGLVGGHCISVDPYYLTYKAESVGYYPQVIHSGRRVNDYMSEFIVSKIVKLLIKKNNTVKGSNALILGITFKENCPDIRNSKIPEIVSELINYGVNVSVYDPLANKTEVSLEYNINLIDSLEKYDAIILAVSHSTFKELDIEDLKKSSKTVIYDIKSFFDKSKVDGSL